MKKHKFGGEWTEEKLDKLGKYYSAYTNIFHKNEKAKFLKIYYVDAFAGTGYWSKENAEEELDSQAKDFLKGSATIALEIEPGFHYYVFLDAKKKHVNELEKLKDLFKSKDIKVFKSDANLFLLKWCKEINWSKSRALILLDPYATEVNWDTIKSIANTQAADLFILFPLSAINRMLTTQKLPTKKWQEKLTKIFGTNEWRHEFYIENPQLSLFNDDKQQIKDTNFNGIKSFVVKRLKSIFPGVLENPLILRNSNNSPLFLLCFAAANPQKHSLAIRIVNDIFGK